MEFVVSLLPGIVEILLSVLDVIAILRLRGSTIELLVAYEVPPLSLQPQFRKLPILCIINLLTLDYEVD